MWLIWTATHSTLADPNQAILSRSFSRGVAIVLSRSFSCILKCAEAFIFYLVSFVYLRSASLWSAALPRSHEWLSNIDSKSWSVSTSLWRNRGRRLVRVSVVTGLSHGPWSSCGRCTHLRGCLCGLWLPFGRQSLNFRKQDSVLTIQ